MTTEQIVAELARLKAENAALKAAKPSPGLGLKVSEKGAVSLYGVGRFPVTLYASQWEAVIAKADTIKQFLADNQALLKTKEAK